MSTATTDYSPDFVMGLDTHRQESAQAFVRDCIKAIKQEVADLGTRGIILHSTADINLLEPASRRYFPGNLHTTIASALVNYLKQNSINDRMILEPLLQLALLGKITMQVDAKQADLVGKHIRDIPLYCEISSGLEGDIFKQILNYFSMCLTTAAMTEQ